MERKQFSYELSEAADADLEEIFDYTAGQFSTEQAIRYLLGLENTFQNLCLHPKLGRERNEIRKNLRSISYESHTVFYRIIKDQVRIVRILHGSRDVVKFLSPKG